MDTRPSWVETLPQVTELKQAWCVFYFAWDLILTYGTVQSLRPSVKLSRDEMNRLTALFSSPLFPVLAPCSYSLQAAATVLQEVLIYYLETTHTLTVPFPLTTRSLGTTSMTEQFCV